MTSKNAYLTTVGRREVQGVSCRVVDGGVSSCTIQPSVPRIFSTCVSPTIPWSSKRKSGDEEERGEPSTNSPDRQSKREKEYAQSCQEWFERKGGKLSFDSTRRPPANSSQHAAVSKYLVFCVGIVTILVTNNLILLPAGILFAYINHTSDLLSIDTSSSYIYYLFFPDGLRKVGCAGNGMERLKHYREKYKDKMPNIISLLNINSIPVRFQKIVTAAVSVFSFCACLSSCISYATPPRLDALLTRMFRSSRASPSSSPTDCRRRSPTRPCSR